MEQMTRKKVIGQKIVFRGTLKNAKQFLPNEVMTFDVLKFRLWFCRNNNKWNDEVFCDCDRLYRAEDISKSLIFKEIWKGTLYELHSMVLELNNQFDLSNWNMQSKERYLYLLLLLAVIKQISDAMFSSLFQKQISIV